MSYTGGAKFLPMSEKHFVENSALAAWNKSVKISQSDYQPFKDEVRWVHWKKHFLNTVKAQGIEATVNALIPIVDPETDIVQQNWMYKVLQDKVQVPVGRGIVMKNETNKDTRLIWQHIKDHYDNNMTMELNIQKLPNYLTWT